MSITKALCGGKYVYANDDLTVNRVRCIYCGCEMYKKRFQAESKGYYFACMPGQVHTNEVCQRYQNKTNMPVLPSTPEGFISSLLKPDDKSGTGPATPSGTRTTGTLKSEDDGVESISKMKSLSQLCKAGIFVEAPLERIWGSDYCYIDYVILKKWAKHVWKDTDLIPIDLRIVEAMWVGSLEMDKKANEDKENEERKNSGWERRMSQFLNDKKELWLTLNGHVNGKATFVRLCLDCHLHFADIKNKLFTAGEEKGKYNTYIPRLSKMNVLVAAIWAIMNKEDCHEKCPLHMCNNCLGAYWGRCTSSKQVQLIDNKYRC